MRKPLFIARQGRRPTGLFGQLVARIMAVETAADNARALDLLDLAYGDHLLEVGCGHGRTLAAAVGRAEGVRATGVDFSDVALAAARRRNRDLVAMRRIALSRADSAALPFRNALFTGALAVHTVYFWEDPVIHLAEIGRVLVPGGRLVLGFRPADDPGFAAAVPAEIYNVRPVAAIERALAGAGFADVRTETGRAGRRLMAWTVACKPPVVRRTAFEERKGAAECA